MTHWKNCMGNPEHFDPAQLTGENSLMAEMAKISREQGTYAASNHYLDCRNVVPKFIRKEDTEFAAARERLATRPGLVIANHPGYLDNPALLSQINRRGLKI